jgi:hypothetical protein
MLVGMVRSVRVGRNMAYLLLYYLAVLLMLG